MAEHADVLWRCPAISVLKRPATRLAHLILRHADFPVSILCTIIHNTTTLTQTCGKEPNLVIVLWGVCTIIHNTMYDRKLTMLGLALLAVTVLLYYMEDETMLQYAYVTGVAMLAIFLLSFIRFNFKYMGSNKK